MPDINKAQEVTEGIVVNTVNNGDLIEGPFYTGGPSSPVGLDEPQRTFYVQNAPGTETKIWLKFGAGVNDWRQLSAQDVPFDPSGFLNYDPSDTDVYKALARIGNFSVGDIAEIEGFNSNATETTTSNGWVSKSGFPWASQSKTAGLFSIRWFFQVGQTKADRNFGYRVLYRLDGGSWIELAGIEFASVGRDNGRFMQSGFKEITLPVDGIIEVDVQHGQTISGFASIMENVSVELRRVGDS